MAPPATLPNDLSSRKRLFASALAVMDLLYTARTAPIPTATPWEPPNLIESDVCPQLPDESRSSEQKYHMSPDSLPRMHCMGVIQGYNRRLAEIAQALAPLDTALLVAGLPKQDVDLWREHRVHAPEVFREPTGVTVASSMLWYVYDSGYMGVFSLPTSEQDEKNQERLERCREAIRRLRRAVFRIDRTVNPQAVLERLRVSDERTEAILDGVSFRRLLPKSEGLYLYHLRLGVGEWVSGDYIAQIEGLAQFKVDRPKATLGDRHPRLRAIIDSNDGKGSRIVLPLAPDAGTGR